MSSGPPASKGMMWSASVAGAFWQMTQVMGPLAKSSLRALLNSGVARRVMLFRFFSSALGCACVCFHVTGWVGAVIAPHSSTYEVWLPDDYTKGRTPLTFVTFGRCTSCLHMRLYPRSRVLCLLSTTPNEAVVLSVVNWDNTPTN
jgi:hypothetical protein